MKITNLNRLTDVVSKIFGYNCINEAKEYNKCFFANATKGDVDECCVMKPHFDINVNFKYDTDADKMSVSFSEGCKNVLVFNNVSKNFSILMAPDGINTEYIISREMKNFTNEVRDGWGDCFKVDWL